MRLPKLGLAAFVLSCALTAGCDTGPGYPCARLEGTVTIDGQPLAEGGLQFLPNAKSQGPTVGGKIIDGRYAVDGIPLGNVRVLFTSIRKTHKLPPSSDGIEKWATENLIPEQHRAGIEMEVTAERKLHDFKLTR